MKKNEMEVASNKIDQKPIRWAVFSEREGKKALIAKLIFTPDGSGNWSATLNSNNVEEAKSLLGFIEKVDAGAPEVPAVTSERSAGKEPDWDKLAKRLKAAGLDFEILPQGDEQVRMEFNLNSGNAVATQEAMHDFAESNPDLARKILRSVHDGLRKITTEIIEGVNLAVSEGEIEDAIAIVKKSREEGRFQFESSGALLEALLRIPVDLLNAADRRMVRECRLMTAHRLQQYAAAAGEAQAMLNEFSSDLTEAQIIDLRMVLATDAAKRGNIETAMLIWRGLLKEPEKIQPGQRGWAWRNISISLRSTEREARDAARFSADAFLEDGMKQEAIISLMRMVECMQFQEPISAIQEIEGVFRLTEEKSLSDRLLRASIYRIRAGKLVELRHHQAALDDAIETIKLLDGLIGAESQLVGSLNLAAIEAGVLGDDRRANEFKQRAKMLAIQHSLPRFGFADRLVKLFASYDSDLASELLREASAENDLEVAAAVKLARATADSSLDDTSRVGLLEEVIRELREANADKGALAPAQLALAHQLVRLEHFDRAELRFREVLSSQPVNLEARDGALHCMWKLEKWGDAAIFLKAEIQRMGEGPGLLAAYGRSLLEAGNTSDAIPVLTKSASLYEGNDTQKKRALDLRERALALGGTIVPQVQEGSRSKIVSTDELTRGLEEFSSFLAAEKRMRFWRWFEGKKRREWVKSPEQFGQDLLHTYLKAKFQERINIFEEISTGAGRLDLYLQLFGGLSVILELKMCGHGYSSTYASSGEDQIRHYMTNRGTSLGFLVVFDSRVDKFGQRLVANPLESQLTVVERVVDVRPTVK